MIKYINCINKSGGFLMNFLTTLFLTIEGGYRTAEVGKATVENAANTQGMGAAGGIMSLFPLLILVVVFIGMNVFMGRKQKKDTMQYEKMISSLKKDDKVITKSGIIGEIVSINDVIIELRVDKGTVIKFQKEAIKGIYHN